MPLLLKPKTTYVINQSTSTNGLGRKPSTPFFVYARTASACCTPHLYLLPDLLLHPRTHAVLTLNAKPAEAPMQCYKPRYCPVNHCSRFLPPPPLAPYHQPWPSPPPAPCAECPFSTHSLASSRHFLCPRALTPSLGLLKH